MPTSNRQIFCSKDCCYQARQDQKKADREAERGNHYYRQRVCAVCGSTYWPTHSQQKFVPRNVKAKPQREIFGILSQEAKGEIRMQKIYYRRKNWYPVRTHRRLLLSLLTMKNEEPLLRS